jgi:hypothetical protein
MWLDEALKLYRLSYDDHKGDTSHNQSKANAMFELDRAGPDEGKAYEYLLSKERLKTGNSGLYFGLVSDLEAKAGSVSAWL